MKKIDINEMEIVKGGSCSKPASYAFGINLIACLFFAPACFGLIVTAPVAILCLDNFVS